MKSQDLSKQIEAAERSQSELTTARDVLEKRVTFLTLQAESLEYPAQQGDAKAKAQHAALLVELSDLAGKLEANKAEAQAVSGNIAALKAEYQAARLDEETTNRNRAALAVIECRQEIEKHQAAITALNARLPELKTAADELNKLVANMGGDRVEYTVPAGSDELKAGFFEGMRVSLLGALSGHA